MDTHITQCKENKQQHKFEAGAVTNDSLGPTFFELYDKSATGPATIVETDSNISTFVDKFMNQEENIICCGESLRDGLCRLVSGVTPRGASRAALNSFSMFLH